jgi:hypothetical protein
MRFGLIEYYFTPKSSGAGYKDAKRKTEAAKMESTDAGEADEKDDNKFIRSW